MLDCSGLLSVKGGGLWPVCLEKGVKDCFQKYGLVVI